MFQPALSAVGLPIQSFLLILVAVTFTSCALTMPESPTDARTVLLTVFAALAPLAPTRDALVASTCELNSVVWVAFKPNFATAN